MSRTTILIEGEEVLRLLAQELARDARAPVSWLAPVRDTYTTSIRWTPDLALRTLRHALGRVHSSRVRVEWVAEPWGQVRASWVSDR